MTRYFAISCGAVALAVPQVAWAGDQPLYGPEPAWVSRAEIGRDALKTGPADLLNDWQQRLEEGVVYAYEDRAVRIDNPQTLMDEGTISFTWLPDKGDLTVHKIEILRDGKEIDLVAQGARLDVLRREQGLEQRLLDGELTATLAVPGLKVGDVLRYSFSTSTADQALGKEVQALQYLPSEPWQVGKARAIMSWPESADIRWRVEDAAKIAEPELRDGYRYLTVALPLAEPAEVPGDAPSRFQRNTVLRVGSYADWQELSRAMAPIFDKAAEIAPDGDVAKQADAIMRRTSDPLERAVLAVRLVQDDVSYLLNGLDGGNYIPQAAEFTWDKRYGDCKAKTVLLTALLRRMGIEAAPTLVVSSGGDALPDLLPLPADFDHAIVLARIGEVDYWLDGTSSATRLTNVANVPPFFHALPLRADGSDLVAMPQRAPVVPDMAMTIDMDHSAGVDLPILMTAKVEIAGAQGAAMQKIVDQRDPAVLRKIARAMSERAETEGVISSVDVAYDKEKALATLSFTGVMQSGFEWKDGRLAMRVGTEASGMLFNPDRARREWKDIPVQTPGTMLSQFDVTMRLPENGKGFTLNGEPSSHASFANMTIDRSVDLAGDRMVTRAKVLQLLGEVAPTDVLAAKLAARKLVNDTNLSAPQDFAWRWQMTAAQRKQRIAPIAAAYQKAIEFAEKDDSGPLWARAAFYANVYDYDAALADYDRLVDRWPSVEAYRGRAYTLQMLGRDDAALADLRAGYDLDPSSSVALQIAQLLGYRGETEEALELIDTLPAVEDDRVSIADAKAMVLGLSGDLEGGLAVVDEALARAPQSADMLNSNCWYRGLFKVGLDAALPICTRAVERAEGAAQALDSRAMVRYRLGLLDDAVADLDAAIEMVPSISPSLYLRGTILLERGEARGKQDIEIARRITPEVVERYKRHGIVPAL